jgi:hypothetical protein
VSPQLLGMNKIISEDALRRSLSRMSAEQSQSWLAPQLMGSVCHFSPYRVQSVFGI